MSPLLFGFIEYENLYVCMWGVREKNTVLCFYICSKDLKPYYIHSFVLTTWMWTPKWIIHVDYWEKYWRFSGLT